MIELHNGDCLEVMADIASLSVDLILTDPPYGTVKGIEKTGHYAAGRGDSHDWDTPIAHADMMNACERLLRKNGTLILFSQDPYTYRLATEYNKNLPFSYRLTWYKHRFANPLSAKKAPVNYTEDLMVFFKKNTKYDFDGFHPLRPYAEAVYSFIGKSTKQITDELGHQGVDHFGRFNSSQFKLCTQKTYDELTALYGLRNMVGFIEYGILKTIDIGYNEPLKERMNAASPKIFNLPEGAGHKSNVLSYHRDEVKLHPTQKPVALLADLIETYTRPGDTVLDFTMGSGSTGAACIETGRNFIGIERDPTFF
ncbi:unnamed protein product, partial [marine sediment metagenome]